MYPSPADPRVLVRCCPLQYITADVWALIEDVSLAKGQLAPLDRHRLPVPYHQAFVAAWSERSARRALINSKARSKE